MSRTRRKSTENKHYWSGYRTLLQYEDREREYSNRYAGWDTPWAQKRVMTEEQIKATAKREFERQFYDGRNGLTCTPISSGFKEKANKVVRRANSRYCYAVMKDEDIWDETSAPIRKEGSKHIWDFW